MSMEWLTTTKADFRGKQNFHCTCFQTVGRVAEENVSRFRKLTERHEVCENRVENLGM